MLYFNRANGGIEGSRNPYWLTAGTYSPSLGTILWSQPEVVLYTHYAAASRSRVGADDRVDAFFDPIGDKLGYPDLFEHDGG